MSFQLFDAPDALKPAVEHYRAGRLQQAEQICRQIIRSQPENADALYFLGTIVYQLDTQKHTADAIRNIPNNLSHTVSYSYQGKLDEAVACYERAIAIRPDLAAAHYSLGVALQSQGKLDEAAACYERAIAIRPDLAAAHFNLGNVLRTWGRRLDEAAACYERAIAIRPDLAPAYNQLGMVFRLWGKPDQAARYYRRAISIDPAFARAYYNLGKLLAAGGQLNAAAALYQRALDIDSNLADAVEQLVILSRKRCDWNRLQELTLRLDALTVDALRRGIRTPETPTGSLIRCSDPARNLAVAQAWARDIAARTTSFQGRFLFRDRVSTKDKIRIGYLSPDFHNHPIGRTAASLFSSHNKCCFEIFAYSSRKDDGSSYRSRIRDSCDTFLDITTMSDFDVARRIYQDHIDILIDLAGHTAGNRMEIFSLRPSPIQASYLGFAGTTGADFIDYIITDKIVTPPHQAEYYTEKFVYLPNCFMVSERYAVCVKDIQERANFNLPENAFVFCSFNRVNKIEPIMFDRWMNILRAVDNSVLWLYCDNDAAKKNIRRETALRGIDIRKIIFADRLSHGENIVRIGLADLGLDTRIYNGGITTTDVLWAGVPVVTLCGDHFASRMSTSMLTAVGLPELATYSLDEYESAAVHLARNPDKLRLVREKLWASRLCTPLYDVPKFIRHLENAYLEMWEIFSNGAEPREIEVVGE